MPGDSFKTSCMYTNNNKDRVFGFGSADEMCIHLLMYYPRKHFGSAPFMCGPDMPAKLQVCEGSYNKVEDSFMIQNSMDYVRPFGTPASVCSLLEQEQVEAVAEILLEEQEVEVETIDFVEEKIDTVEDAAVVPEAEDAITNEVMEEAEAADEANSVNTASDSDIPTSLRH